MLAVKSLAIHRARWKYSSGSSFLRDGAEGPAVVENLEGTGELMLGRTVGCHDLDECEEEGAVFVWRPLGCHVWM